MDTTTTDAPTVSFDLDAVTPRMLIDFKTATGHSLLALVDDDGDLDLKALPEEVIAGVAWLGLRMGGRPDATFEDALDVPFTALVGAASEVPAPDPT